MILRLKCHLDEEPPGGFILISMTFKCFLYNKLIPPLAPPNDFSFKAGFGELVAIFYYVVNPMCLLRVCFALIPSSRLGELLIHLFCQNFRYGYSVANGSVTAKGIRRKYSILPRLTTKKAICTGNKAKQFFPRYYRLQVNPATPRERRVQAHLELAELVEDPRTLTCYAEIKHAIGFLLPRNRD
ncbi:hypothetical protein NQ317_014045 [Molorchus minor]|uniref:Uncharacterized protein n=1 Tax=Molorchus minor TaxID=1323400 RepID=A0ABQ9JZI4_9CUCU|nr:hypothetical protein NQ317_014045 [Molorchus minor]